MILKEAVLDSMRDCGVHRDKRYRRDPWTIEIYLLDQDRDLEIKFFVAPKYTRPGDENGYQPNRLDSKLLTANDKRAMLRNRRVSMEAAKHKDR